MAAEKDDNAGGENHGAMGIMIMVAAGIITMILMPWGVALPKTYAISYSYGCVRNLAPMSYIAFGCDCKDPKQAIHKRCA